MRLRYHWITFGLAILLTNCVSLTVNVYFPTTEIKQAAEEIEERVRSGKGTEGLEDESSFVPFSPAKRQFAISISLGGKEAYGQDLNIEIETPTIKQIIKSRTERYKKTEPYLDKGWFGEAMDGYLILRKTKGVDLKTLTTLKKLVLQENDDREKLYQEILSANNLTVNKENMKKVGELFFEAIKKKMKAGHYYQVGKEEWKEKVKEKDEQ